MACCAENPGAANFTTLGAKNIVRAQTTSKIPSKRINASDIRLNASCLSLRKAVTNEGINAADKAPSAKIFLRELGILYAVIKASEAAPTPKYLIVSSSLIIPRNGSSMLSHQSG